MDLKLKEVAGLLNTSEGTVKKWVIEGKIPSYKIRGQLRFSRMEIESWFLNNKGLVLPQNDEDAAEAPLAGSQKFSLYRALHKGHVLQNVKGATKEAVFKSAAKSIGQEFEVDSDLLTELLLLREHLQPTSLGHGIGVPHSRDFLLSPTHDIAVIAFPQALIDYGALDERPVHTLIFLFACNDKRHLHLLAKAAHLSSQPPALQFLQSRPSKEELLSYLQEWEGKVPVLA